MDTVIFFVLTCSMIVSFHSDKVVGLTHKEVPAQEAIEREDKTEVDRQRRAALKDHKDIDMDQLEKMYRRYFGKKSKPGQFLCEIPPPSSVPSSVHSLKPSDIRVIGAMGDSLTAGTGVTATNLLDELTQNRGLSWSGGGQGTVKEHITMPNIMKKFATHLYGFAVGDGNENSVFANFNVAKAGSDSSHLVKQARMLCDRIKANPNVDFVNDWKVITILSGNNDLCDSCKNPKYTQAQFYENMIRALDILHQELPRTLINLVSPINMGVVTQLNKGFLCKTLHFLICGCAAFPETKEDEEQIWKLTRQYQNTVKEIAASGRYDTRQDFTVVYQPFFNETVLPKTEDGEPDLSYFAPDCFHLSSKGQEAAALALWNNMITPVHEKRGKWSTLDKLTCPSKDQPYIYTNTNSQPQAPLSPANVSEQFSQPIIIATTVCGLVVIIIGVPIIFSIVRRLRNRDLYIQIPAY